MKIARETCRHFSKFFITSSTSTNLNLIWNFLKVSILNKVGAFRNKELATKTHRRELFLTSCRKNITDGLKSLPRLKLQKYIKEIESAIPYILFKLVQHWVCLIFSLLWTVKKYCLKWAFQSVYQSATNSEQPAQSNSQNWKNELEIKVLYLTLLLIYSSVWLKLRSDTFTTCCEQLSIRPRQAKKHIHPKMH